MAEAQQDAAMRSFVESAMPGLEQLAAQLGVKKTHTPEELKVITEAAMLYARDGGDSSQGGEVGGAAPDASSGGKKKTRRGGKKKKKPAADPFAKLSHVCSKSEEAPMSAAEFARVNSEFLALSKDVRETILDKLNVVCPEAIKGINKFDKTLIDIDWRAMDDRTLDEFKAEVEIHRPLALLELDLPVAVDADSAQLLRHCCACCHGIFVAAKTPDRFQNFVQVMQDYAAEDLSAEDLSAQLADLFGPADNGKPLGTREEQDVLLKQISQIVQAAYPASQRAELRRTRAEAEAKARAEAEAARPPKPLTGAAALLETLDKFKAQNGGVDDPYYAAMRSALEELDIEERGACPEGA